MEPVLQARIPAQEEDWEEAEEEEDPVIARSINSYYNLGGIVEDKSTKERQE